MGFESGIFGAIRFSLNSRERGKEFIEDPINWDDSEREYSRNQDFMGIFSKLSNNLQFTKRGFRYLIDLYQNFGIEPDIVLEKEGKNTKRADERWEVIENGYLNLSELAWNDQDRVAQVKFDEVGFWQRINNRKSQKHDLIPETTADGVNIGPLPTRTLRANGRDIFLRSELRPNSEFATSFSVDMPDRTSFNAPRFGNKGLPFVVRTNSDRENINSVLVSSLPGKDDNQNGSGQDEFFLVSDRDKRDVRIRLNFSFTIDSIDAENIATGAEHLRVFFRRYTDGSDLTLDSSETILEVALPQNRVGEEFTINFDRRVDIRPDESLAFIIQTSATILALNPGAFNVNLRDLSGSLVVEEDSVFAGSTHEVLLPHEKFERLVTILTGEQNAFYSEYFGRTDLGYDQDGAGAYIACASGFMVREFPNVINEGTDEEKRIQYKTSFRDLYDSYNSITPLAVFLEGSGTNIRLRVEPIEFIYQKFIGIELKRNDQFLQITELERKVDSSRIYSDIKIGSKTELRYLEAFGLDEFNGMSEFTTIHTKVENTYEAVSEYRKDSYGHEFARRQRYPDAPETDTRYDQDIFMLDCKPVGNFLELRLWQDDFERAPTGIYSPSTVFNLNLSPANTLLNHSILFGASLIQYRNSFTTFASSNSNSSLSTKKVGQPEIVEDGQIQNSDFRRPLFIPETFEFEIPLDDELIKTIEDNNENNIPNVFGYLRIETRDGFEHLYIDNLKVSDNGRFTCTKAWL